MPSATRSQANIKQLREIIFYKIIQIPTLSEEFTNIIEQQPESLTRATILNSCS